MLGPDAHFLGRSNSEAMQHEHVATLLSKRLEGNVGADVPVVEASKAKKHL